jgi:hypothetical protein
MDLGDLFKKLVWDNLVKLALNKLFGLLPQFLVKGFLGSILTPFITHFLIKFTDELYEFLKMTVDFQLVIFKVEGLEKKFTDAAVALHEVALQNGIESPEFETARKASDEDFFSFVELNFTKRAA